MIKNILLTQFRNFKYQDVFTFLLSTFFLFSIPDLASGYDLSEKFTIDLVGSGVYQYVLYDETVEDLDDTGRGTVAVDLGANFHPTDSDEFQVTLSFAAGNALNDQVPFVLTPYADDLEDDLKNINGRNRDYLLEAWYKHTFTFSERASLGLAGGIIDSTAYIDENNFASDENFQFMNEAFVNHRSSIKPSYDLGGVATLEISHFTITGLFMNTNNEEGTNYNYYAAQLSHRHKLSLGEGNIRVWGFITGDKFNGFDGETNKQRKGIIINADQELGENFGVFMRIGWQDDNAESAVYQSGYTGGFNIEGILWGREDDNVGIGYGYLSGNNKGDIRDTNVFEMYYRLHIFKYSDLSFDFQYMKDALNGGAENSGYILGTRLTAYF